MVLTCLERLPFDWLTQTQTPMLVGILTSFRVPVFDLTLCPPED